MIFAGEAHLSHTEGRPHLFPLWRYEVKITMHEPTSGRSGSPKKSTDALRTASAHKRGQRVLGVLLGLTLLVGGLPSAALAERPDGKAHVDSLVLSRRLFK